MSKVRLIVAMLLAVFAFSALASASASAATAGWMVKGTNLATNAIAKIALPTVTDEEYSLVGSQVNIRCKNLDVEGGIIEGPSMALVSSLVFLECKSETANCTLTSPTIGTVPLLGEATLDAANVLAAQVTFKPETKNAYATFAYEGASCALTGTQVVTGKATVLAPEGADERTVQRVVVNTNELLVGSSAATLKGQSLLKLETGEPWSYL